MNKPKTVFLAATIAFVVVVAIVGAAFAQAINTQAAPSATSSYGQVLQQPLYPAYGFNGGVGAGFGCRRANGGFGTQNGYGAYGPNMVSACVE